MQSEASMTWLHDSVMWRIEQSGAVYFEEDYYKLAYDDNVAAGVVIDETVADLQARFDAASDDEFDSGQSGNSAPASTNSLTL